MKESQDMKTSTIRLLGICLSLMPLMANAQTNIKSAFDAIIKCPEVQITESHTLDKDPSTRKKTGQSDVYGFVLPASREDLLKNVVSAFEQDAEMAYSINKGMSSETERDIMLAVGITGNDGIIITSPGCEYIYSLFLAPLSEDPNGIYRYAYGLNYKEEGGKFIGRLVITYATTLNYRQQTEQQRQYDMFRNLSNGAYVITGNNSSQQSWFDMLMSYFQSMTQANTQTRIALASKAFKAIRGTSKYPDVTDADKDAVREILKGMISDKKYSESVLNKLLTQCLVELK